MPWKKPVIKDLQPTKWQWMVQHTKNFKLAKNTDIGAFTYINAHYGVEIGEGVQIGSHCSLYSHSTIDNKKGAIIIKKNAKVGSHCTLMPGVQIGEGAVFGAHSFVNQNIPDHTLALGVPARIIKIL